MKGPPMRATILALLVTASAACAYRDPAHAAYPKLERSTDQDRVEEAGQRMRDEFNNLFPDG